MNISIVIVEDLDEVREGLANYITMHPDFFVAGSFRTAEDALQKIPQIQPDIAIMDINLPGMDGIQCIRELKNKTPGTQFMMFTVYENDERVFEALKAGAASYLLKNTGLMQLTEALKELHNGGSPMSASIARKLISHFNNQPSQSNPVDTLTQRENEILALLAKGLLYKEIAEKLSIAVNTVRQHIHKIYEKLHVQNRTEAINKAFGKN
jgi:DNA-binding NarL/FixJ family response regulator